MPNELRDCLFMARIPLARQSVQVHSIKASIILSSPPCVHAQCKFIIFYPNFTTYNASDLQLPDDIQDAYMAIYQRAPSSATLTHLKRELIHAVYELILNSKFVNAYKEGLVITCYDGIKRRLFPRLLTYSGDYPEKQVTFNFFMLCTNPSLELCLPASSSSGSTHAHGVL